MSGCNSVFFGGTELTIICREIPRKNDLGVKSDAQKQCCQNHTNDTDPKVGRLAIPLRICNIDDIAWRSREERLVHVHVFGMEEQSFNA
jgi:hypothetical protein